MIWISERLRRLLCALRGHDIVLSYHPGRLSLRCLACSFRTSGWDLGPEIRYAPSPADNPLPVPPGDPARPLAIDGDAAGERFAPRSARADRSKEEAARRAARAMRLAS